jgi:hypothetical protein
MNIPCKTASLSFQTARSTIRTPPEVYRMVTEWVLELMGSQAPRFRRQIPTFSSVNPRLSERQLCLPSPSREPDAHRIFGRAAETRSSGDPVLGGSKRPRQARGAGRRVRGCAAETAEKPLGLFFGPAKTIPSSGAAERKHGPSDRPTADKAPAGRVERATLNE